LARSDKSSEKSLLRDGLLAGRGASSIADAIISRTHESNHHPCAIALRNVVRNPFAWPRFLLGTVLVICVIQIPSPAPQAFADGVAKLNRQARAAIAAEHWEVAAASYDKAIQLAPKTAKLRVELGMLLTKLGRLPDEIVMYQKALRIAPQKHACGDRPGPSVSRRAEVRRGETDPRKIFAGASQGRRAAGRSRTKASTKPRAVMASNISVLIMPTVC